MSNNTRRHTGQVVAWLLFPALLAPAACAPSPDAEENGGQWSIVGGAPAPDAAAEAGGPQAGGLTWSVPERWTDEGPRPMRAGSYVVPAAAGDPADAELGVFFFGQGQGGTNEANLQRWIGQFESADGGPVTEVERGTRTIAGFQTTILEVSGTYKGTRRHKVRGGEPLTGYRLLAAIVHGPEGSVFFKLTGPESTVEAARAEYEALLDSIR